MAAHYRKVYFAQIGKQIKCHRNHGEEENNERWTEKKQGAMYVTHNIFILYLSVVRCPSVSMVFPWG